MASQTAKNRSFYFGLILFVGLLNWSCASPKMNIKQDSPYAKFIAQQKTFTLSIGKNLHYIDQGEPNEKVILLVHGVPTSSWLYRKMIPLLVDNGYRVIAPDMLGYGQSDKPKGYDLYKPENMGSYLLELMKHLEIKEWTHVCHDAGGLWSWEMMKKDKSGVRNLVILNTILFKEGFNPPMQMKRNIFSKLYVRTYTADLSRKGMMKATLNNGLANNKVCVPDMIYGYSAPTQGHLNRALYTFFSNTCIKELPDYSGLFKAWDVPKKVIWGAQDEILNWSKQKEKAIKILNLEEKDVLILEDAKHFIQEEKPQAIVNFIVK